MGPLETAGMERAGAETLTDTPEGCWLAGGGKVRVGVVTEAERLQVAGTPERVVMEEAAEESSTAGEGLGVLLAVEGSSVAGEGVLIHVVVEDSSTAGEGVLVELVEGSAVAGLGVLVLVLVLVLVVVSTVAGEGVLVVHAVVEESSMAGEGVLVVTTPVLSLIPEAALAPITIAEETGMLELFDTSSPPCCGGTDTVLAEVLGRFDISIACTLPCCTLLCCGTSGEVDRTNTADTVPVLVGRDTVLEATRCC